MERLEEGYHRECVRGGGEQSEVRDELIFRTNLQVVPKLGLAVQYGVLFHSHECGRRISFTVGIPFPERFQMTVILAELVRCFSSPSPVSL